MDEKQLTDQSRVFLNKLHNGQKLSLFEQNLCSSIVQEWAEQFSPWLKMGMAFIAGVVVALTIVIVISIC